MIESSCYLNRVVCISPLPLGLPVLGTGYEIILVPAVSAVLFHLLMQSPHRGENL